MMEIRNGIGKKPSKKNGFTLIEVIAVLVIVAIIAAVVVARGMSTADVNLQAETDTLKSHLRYAQYLALNDIYPIKWGIQISGDSYKLVRSGNGAAIDSTTPYNLPGESSDTHSISPITATATVLFDEWGSPYNEFAKLTGNAAWTITLTQGSQSKSIEIIPETGFIP